MNALTHRPIRLAAPVTCPRRSSRSRRPAPVFLAALAIFLASGTAFAQLPLTRLTTIFPTGGKAGTAVEVEVTGQDFEELGALMFSHPGITAQAKEGAANRYVVNIGGDVPPGCYEAWLAGRFGLSNPRLFVVDALEQLTDAGGNHEFAKAVELPLNMVFHGRADGNVADYFKLTLQQGQRVMLECLAPEIDSRMEQSLAVFDATGRELKRARHASRLDFTAPAEGVFFVQVHDFLFRGGHEHFYRLVASTAPHVEFILPASAPAGTKHKFALFGRNLPGGHPASLKAADGSVLERVEVEIQLPPATDAARWSTVAAHPASAAVNGFEHRLPSAQGPSNPVFIGFADAPVVLEQEPNNERATPQPLTLPAEVTGQFFPARDRDWYAFDAKKGDVWWLEVFAHRLGHNCNPYVLVQRVWKNEQGVEQSADVLESYDTGANLGGREFNTSHRDWLVRFQAPEDGSYRVLLRDLFNVSADDPSVTYRLAIRRESPDFRIAAMPEPPPPAKNDQRYIHVTPTALRRGETLPVNVYAFRRDNFNGAIELAVEGLPAGVRAGPARIEAGRNSTQITLTADEGAATWSGHLKITGRAKIGETDVTRLATAATLRWNVGDWNTEPVVTRLSGALPLSVIGAETAPLTVGAAENKLFEVQEGAKLQVPLLLTRRAEFNANLKLKAVGVPALDKLKELDVDGKATNATLEVNLAEHKLPPGMHTFFLRAQTAGKYRNNPEAAAAADADLKTAEQAAADAAEAAKKAAEALAAATKAAEEAAKQAQSASASDKPALEAKAKEAADTKAAAEKASNDAAAKAKEAEAAKNAAAERAKAANEKAKPRDVTIMVYSQPITVKVNPAPPAPSEKK
jgi:hypothetical protein